MLKRARMAWREIVLAAIVLFGGLKLANADEPQLNDRFPVKDPSNLSPPIVAPPIHECALAAYVYGFIPGATVSVFANGSELIGQANPVVGFAEIKLTRALVLGDSSTARQKVGGVKSGHSYDPVIVEPYPVLTKPVAGPDVFACGRVVPVDNLVASTHVEVSDVETNSVIGTGEATGPWEPIVTSSLVAGHHVRAVQIACPNNPAKKVIGPSSDPVAVKPEPSPLLPPKPDDVVPGNNVIILHKQVVGAEELVHNGPTTLIGDGLAAAETAWQSVAPPIPAVPTPPGITATQKLCTSSKPSDPAHVLNQLPPPILGAPICEASHYVTVDNTVLNANVVLLRGGLPIGYGGPVLGTLKLGVGFGVNLNTGNVLTAVQYIGAIISPPSNAVTVGCGSGGDVVTQHNDNYRTGLYPAETTLTPAQVLARGMHIKYKHAVDGGINAQPLYVRRVAFSKGAANGLFVATCANKVYGLDADTGTEKWVTPLKDSDPGKRGISRCISSTPVIDVPNHRLYILFSTKNQLQDGANCPDSTHPDSSCGTYEDQLGNLDVAYWLVALDYRDGSEKARVRVAASRFRTNGTLVNFVAKNQVDRPGVLLQQGSVYIAFAMRFREEIIEYHGWVMRYRASDLAFQSAFCSSRDAVVPTSPFTSHIAQGAGIWQGGGGLAGDPNGNVYFLTGNAHADIAKGSFGDSFVKLTPSGSSLVPAVFVPPGANTLEANDADLGSGGTLTFPGFNLVIGGGKTGFMYLLDQSTMKLVQQITASTNQYNPALRDQGWDVGPHLHGSPTYWRGPDSKFGNLYVWGEKDKLRQYQFNTPTKKFVQPAVHTGPVTALADTMPGGMISISANGNATASGIVWATLPASNKTAPGSNNYPGRLYAFHAETLKPLWDTGFSSLGKWLPPTIADAKVFIGTSSNELIVYELGPQKGGHSGMWKAYQPPPGTTRAPLHERYMDEQSVHALPALALNVLAPPGDHVRDLVMEGNGVQIYEASQGADAGGKLTWTLKGSRATLTIVDINGVTTKPVQVQLLPGPVWSAADGSTATGELEKTHPAPEKTDTPWVLFKVIKTSGSGILTAQRYIQCVFTRGGQAPEGAPSRPGETREVPYYAQYITYRSAQASPR